MPNKIKENAMNDFLEMIKKSWTYQKLSEKEVIKLNDAFQWCIDQKMIFGSYKQRMNILQCIYNSFLNGLGYNGWNWRKEQ